MTNKTKSLFSLAQKYIPSGVNSPVRAFKAVGGAPVFIRKGKSPFLWDESGKKYIDFCMSWGALIFGHSPAGLIQTLRREIEYGTSFGAATQKEVKLAREINSFFPSMEKIRLVSSGTEAVMSAIRLARGFTGRKKILKIDGGYHGHADSLLVKAGSGAATFGIPDSAGVPDELARLTLSIPFNDMNALEKVFKKEGRNLAAFILEPVPANMGVILPKAGYLEAARKLTKKYGALLIFDEVITGFRISRGGAQQSFGIQPDLTTLGKILGGGLPIAAFGGRSKIMDQLAPAGPVYQAGTLSGNPMAVTAALWMLQALKSRDFDSLSRHAVGLTAGLRKWIRENDLPLCVNAMGSMFTLFFTHGPVTDYASAKKSDTERYAKFFHAALKAGIYLAPSQFEANFISSAHTPAQLKSTLRIFQKILGRN
ncbi:MAG: glutamate-1-semialdehyde 2,1-aminomutase [Candidatus Omnitrophica bacterium]|nr:glutamate-1-semialdehyde 2,1-aminomutase [Candidatus Omnitrophota bacterium]